MRGREEIRKELDLDDNRNGKKSVNWNKVFFSRMKIVAELLLDIRELLLDDKNRGR